MKEGQAPAYGWIVEASIAKGRIADLDTSTAEAATGVRVRDYPLTLDKLLPRL